MQDWSNFAWQEFTVSNGCGDGYEPIGNEWLGTVEGNYTDSGVEKTDTQWQGQIDPNPAVWQYGLFPYVTEKVICGKRSIYSYENAVRVEMSGSVEGGDAAFECPKDRYPCATNTALGGTTLCVDNVANCPITVFFISDSSDTATKYPTYTQILFEDGENLALYYTTGTNERSNAPI